MTRNTVSAGLLAVAMLAGAGAAQAQKVTTDYDRQADFSRFHTFSIYRVHASNNLDERRLSDDIAAALQKHGWQQVPQGGDIAVTAVGNVRNQQEYTTFYNGLGPGWGYGGWGGWYGWGGGWGGRSAITQSYTIPVGTLAVDLYDTSNHNLVFRGIATDELSKNSDKNIRKGEKAVDKIFDRLPNKVG